MAENEEELKSLLMRAEEESKNIGLKLNIQGRRRSLELGWGAEATEGPCGLRGGPDLPGPPPSHGSDSAAARLIAVFVPSIALASQAAELQPARPWPQFGSCRADAAAGPGFGL